MTPYRLISHAENTDAPDLRELGDRISEAALAAQETDADVTAAVRRAAAALGVEPLPDDVLAGVLEDLA